jgi:two-component system, cell cycle sensor histidine kinase and response regulator CckA
MDADHRPVDADLAAQLARVEDALRLSEARFCEVAAENERLQSEFLQAQKMEAVGRLASGVAHDFKNVLTLIAGYTDILLRRFDDPEGREAALEIQSACHRAIELTRQLLAFSKKETRDRRGVSLNALLTDASRMLRRLLSEDIELSIRQDPALGLVSADAGQLHQVLLNLVVNARDAMPAGGRLVIETRNVEVEAGSPEARAGVPTGAHVRLSVEDNGVGMDEPTRRRALEPFFTTKEGKTGTGLGLSTVDGIVRQSLGSILLESEPGRGTSVLIYLPQAAAPPGAPGRAAAPADTGALAMRRVLVVDADEGIRHLLADVLSGAGFDVDAAASMSALGASAEAAPWTAAVVDLSTIECDGGEAWRLFLGRRPDLVVVAMATSVGSLPAAAARRLGIGATIAKPIAPRQVLRAVRDLIDAA